MLLYRVKQLVSAFTDAIGYTKTLGRTYFDEDRQRHRDDGPAHTAIDPDTGVLTHELYYRHGKFHREDGPAITLRDARTGEITKKVYFWDGEQAPVQPGSEPEPTVF